MKKTCVTILLVLMVALLAVGPASAQKGKINIKGEVTAMGGGTLTVLSNKGETYVVTVPAGIDVSAIQVGDSIQVKASAGDGDAWLADSIKLVGGGNGNGDDDAENEAESEDEDNDNNGQGNNKGQGNDKAKGKDKDKKDKPEGFKDNSAFCALDKQDKPHPLAPKIAERYGVSEGIVMGYFCEGYSIGAIMLAIKTSQLEGATANPGDLLAKRAAGNAWGLIWKGLGLIGSEKNGHSPPGLLNKPDHAGPKK